MLKGGRPPNRALMYQKHMPYSKGPTLELAGVQMRTWWSFDGKRHMLDIVHFLVIVNKYSDNNAKTIWRNIKKKLMLLHHKLAMRFYKRSALEIVINLVKR